MGGYAQVVMTLHLLTHCSYLVENCWGREAMNSSFGWLGDVTFSLAVSPNRLFLLLVTPSLLSDTRAWRVAIVMCFFLSRCLCSPSYVVSCGSCWWSLSIKSDRQLSEKGEKLANLVTYALTINQVPHVFGDYYFAGYKHKYMEDFTKGAFETPICAEE
jgi:hypothetical protein